MKQTIIRAVSSQSAPRRGIAQSTTATVPPWIKKFCGMRPGWPHTAREAINRGSGCRVTPRGALVAVAGPALTGHRAGSTPVPGNPDRKDGRVQYRQKEQRRREGSGPFSTAGKGLLPLAQSSRPPITPRTWLKKIMRASQRARVGWFGAAQDQDGLYGRAAWQQSRSAGLPYRWFRSMPFRTGLFLLAGPASSPAWSQGCASGQATPVSARC
ncbi:hypothetical protein Are01nite_35520 [Actinoplanes regularis]|nr:hypothetical protein Are01nite_35520 [Actinoplanes regularis]